MNTRPTSRPSHTLWRGALKWLSGFFRWLHLYASLAGFTAILFFAWTGITLNHPTWFGGETGTTHTETGTLPEELRTTFDKLSVAEHLRETHHLRGKVADFRIDDSEGNLALKGPGYSADLFIDRQSGNYEATIVEYGWIGKWNDLHKGRDSGPLWSWVIDLSAIIMIVSSITGLGMLCFMRKKRSQGLWTTAVGTALFVLFYYWFIP